MINYIRNPRHPYDKTLLCEVDYVVKFLQELKIDIKDPVLIQTLDDFSIQLMTDMCIPSYAYSVKENNTNNVVPNELMIMCPLSDLPYWNISFDDEAQCLEED